MNKIQSLSRRKQQGIAIWHVLLLVGIAVTLALCAKSGTVPYFQKPAPGVGQFNPPKISLPSFSNNNAAPQPQPSSPAPTTVSYQQSRPPAQNVQVSESLFVSEKKDRVKPAPTLVSSAYEDRFPANLASGFYTVQVFSGYNSKSAYDLERALRNEGYNAYIKEVRDHRGIMFKVRIGQYTNRSDAFAMSSKIKTSYPKQMGKSFVLLNH